ncbi:MAG: hypothetical protein Q9181_000953 [Wetmoreana brouardii]
MERDFGPGVSPNAKTDGLPRGFFAVPFEGQATYGCLKSIMTARCFNSCAPQLHKVSIGNTFLPFLYQTRTIQRPIIWSPKARNQFHTSGVRQGVYVKHDASSDAIPFETDFKPRESEDDLFAQSTEDTSARHLRKSTITASEKAVFDRIFKEISEDASKNAAKEEDPLDDDLEDESPTPGGPYDDLNALFDSVLKQATPAGRKDSSAQGGERIRSFVPGSYKTAIDLFKHTDYRKLERSVIRGDEFRQDIQKAVMNHERRVITMFDEAKTDREIWNVLETEVFSLIKKYETYRELAEEQEKAKRPKRKRGRVSKAEQEAAAEAEKKQELLAAGKSTQEEQLQAILSSNYGEYCLAAMRHLRRSYPTSPYCMNLLPTIKRLGPISHVLAASAELYNEILFLEWKEYSDLHGMADMLIEMGDQAIESNEVTIQILKMVKNAKRRIRVEDHPMQLWWELRSVRRGWERLRELAKRVYQEVKQAKERKSLEEAAMGDGMDVEGDPWPLENLRTETLPEKRLRLKGVDDDEATRTTIIDGGLGPPNQPIML